MSRRLVYMDDMDILLRLLGKYRTSRAPSCRCIWRNLQNDVSPWIRRRTAGSVTSIPLFCTAFPVFLAFSASCVHSAENRQGRLKGQMSGKTQNFGF